MKKDKPAREDRQRAETVCEETAGSEEARGEQQTHWGIPLRREFIQPAAEDGCRPLGQRGKAGVGRDDVVLFRFIGAEVRRKRERVSGWGGLTHRTVTWRIKTLQPGMISLPIKPVKGQLWKIMNTENYEL